jgi:hypothetical protein
VTPNAAGGASDRAALIWRFAKKIKNLEEFLKFFADSADKDRDVKQIRADPERT